MKTHADPLPDGTGRTGIVYSLAHYSIFVALLTKCEGRAAFTSLASAIARGPTVVFRGGARVAVPSCGSLQGELSRLHQATGLRARAVPEPKAES